MMVPVREHLGAAQDCLRVAEGCFSRGEDVQGVEEMLWGAAAYGVIAAAQQRGWAYWNHNATKTAVYWLAGEGGDSTMGEDFAVAELFHRNFYHGNLEDFQVNFNRLRVRRLVETLRGVVNLA